MVVVVVVVVVAVVLVVLVDVVVFVIVIVAAVVVVVVVVVVVIAVGVRGHWLPRTTAPLTVTNAVRMPADRHVFLVNGHSLVTQWSVAILAVTLGAYIQRAVTDQSVQLEASMSSICPPFFNGQSVRLEVSMSSLCSQFSVVSLSVWNPPCPVRVHSSSVVKSKGVYSSS